jgi:hypothetical protein
VLSAKHTISGDIRQIGENRLSEYFGIYYIQQKSLYPAAYEQWNMVAGLVMKKPAPRCSCVVRYSRLPKHIPLDFGL